MMGSLIRSDGNMWRENSPMLSHSHQLFPNGNQPEIQRDVCSHLYHLDDAARCFDKGKATCNWAFTKIGHFASKSPGFYVMASGILSYNFAMDPERLEENDLLSALGHSLEIAFKTWKLGTAEVPFRERGPGLEALEGICKRAVRDMSPGDYAVFQDAWIERLIKAALDSGAKIPQKKRKAVEEAPPVAAACSIKENSH
ncbi:hypothetical protein B0H14DRAFT_2564022 [Mycena olivaceomarginata]|nr:hypothetical protein B0H14DRAFT_2564022 [Mycena olivaceomarginata]